jgi:hypothetical protein
MHHFQIAPLFGAKVYKPYLKNYFILTKNEHFDLKWKNL